MINDPIARTGAEQFVDRIVDSLPDEVSVAVDKDDLKFGAVIADLDDIRRTVSAQLHDMLDRQTIEYEREVNQAGVAVRRLVLRGEWEVDNAALTSGAAR